MFAKELTEDMRTPRGRDYAKALLFNSLLSGAANIKNAGSNAFYLAFNLGIHEPFKALLGMIPFVPNTDAHWSGLLAGWKSISVEKAWGSAKEAYKYLHTPGAMENKWEHDIAGALNVLTAPKAHPFAKAISPIMKPVVGGLIAVDAFFRSMAFDFYHAQALANKGLTLESATEEQLVEIKKEAIRRAASAVFSDEPGKLTKGIYSIRRAVDRSTLIGGTVVIPFVNTLANIMYRGLELVPGAGLALSMPNLKEGKTTGLDVAAKQLEGAVLTLILLALFKDDRITGAQPEDPAKREAFIRRGKMPYAIKIGDTWASYQNIEPMNMAVGSIVSFRDALIAVGEDQAIQDAVGVDKWTRMFSKVASIVTSNIIDNSFLGYALRLTEERGLKSWLSRIPSNFVPYGAFWRLVNKTIEADETKQVLLRENKDFLSNLIGSLPIGTSKLPARISAFGEPLAQPTDALQLWLPIQWRVEGEPDAVEAELQKHKMYPKLPDRHIVVQNTDIFLPEEFYRDYVIQYGIATKAAFKKAIESPSYARASEDRQKSILSSRVARGRARERIKLLRLMRRSGLL